MKINDGTLMRWIGWTEEETDQRPKTNDELAHRWLHQTCESNAGVWCPCPWVEVVHAALLAMEMVNPDFRITQIKSKFSGLRLYWHLDDPSEEDPVAEEALRKDRILLSLIVNWAEDNVALIERGRRNK